MQTDPIPADGKSMKWRALLGDPHLWIPIAVLIAGLVVLAWIA